MIKDNFLEPSFESFRQSTVSWGAFVLHARQPFIHFRGNKKILLQGMWRKDRHLISVRSGRRMHVLIVFLALIVVSEGGLSAHYGVSRQLLIRPLIPWCIYLIGFTNFEEDIYLACVFRELLSMRIPVWLCNNMQKIVTKIINWTTNERNLQSVHKAIQLHLCSIFTQFRILNASFIHAPHEA
jgi:hypothetical protein